MATEAPTKKKSKPSPTKSESAAAATQQTDEITGSPQEGDDEGEDLLGADRTLGGDDDDDSAGAEVDAHNEHEEQLDILEPLSDPKQWTIGKPPAMGGTEDEYSVYVQRPLDYMPRMRFFSLVSRTLAQAIKAGGVINVGGSDVFGAGGGTMRERVERIQAGSFEDAGSFMTLAMELISYSPDFLLECYCLWLSVPSDERRWAKAIMSRPWRPDDKQWGLTDEQHMELVEIFIDQNYEDIRDFFAVDLPRLGRRVQQKEKARAARESESGQSKQ